MYIKLTSLSNKPIFINPKNIESILSSSVIEATEINTNSKNRYYVKEDLDTIVQFVEKTGYYQHQPTEVFKCDVCGKMRPRSESFYSADRLTKKLQQICLDCKYKTEEITI